MGENKPGRPLGTTQRAEKKTKNVTVKLTPHAYQWVKDKPRGWLSDFLEEESQKPRP